MEAPPAIPVPAEGRRLETPSRQTLLSHYAKTEAMCRTILFFEAAVGAVALYWIVFHAERPFGPWPWVALAIGGLGVFRWFMHHVFLSKKRIEDIRPDARFGEHTRDSLVKLSAGVFARLGLKPGCVPVFLTRAKDVNAHAIRCELWPGLHVFNGVFLNRSIIHLLDERELASVIGHELGHVIPYAPLLSRTYIVHSLVAGVLSFALVAAFKYPGVAFVGPIAILALLNLIIAFPHLRLSRGIEFLCDDFGAQAAGLLPALSTEFKMAAESETRQELLRRTLESRKKGSQLNLTDLVEAYEEAVPFGKADPQQFEQEFQKLSSAKQQSARNISVGGFLSYIGGSGDTASAEEFIDEQIKQLTLVKGLPLLPVDRLPYLLGSTGWTIEAAERLVSEIERNSRSVLFQLEHELDDRGVTHPNVSRRLLYLWRNRTAYPLH